MSLRYASKVGYEAWMRMKDQTISKSESGVIKCFRDSSSSKVQARCFSGAVESPVESKADDKYKQTEESLRTVMYLSCWAPN